MEREGAAAGMNRRWESAPEDVIVLSAGRPPRHLQQAQQPSAGMVAAAVAGLYSEPLEKVFYKTKLCEKYETIGRCLYDENCTFAHGHAELRPPLPVLGAAARRASEAEHAKGFHGGGGSNGLGRLCFEFRDTGRCHFGDRCSYSHASAPGAQMRNPGGAKLVEARRSPTPSGRASSQAAAAPHACNYFPSPPARAFPPARAAAIRDRLAQLPEEDGVKLSPLALLSGRKMGGIYGDWPEQN